MKKAGYHLRMFKTTHCEHCEVNAHKITKTIQQRNKQTEHQSTVHKHNSLKCPSVELPISFLNEIYWLHSDSVAEGTSLTPVLIVPKDFHKALFIQK